MIMKNKNIFPLIVGISLLAGVLIYLINNTSQWQLIGSIICLTAILLTDIYYFWLFFNKSNFYIPSSQYSIRRKKWTLLALSCANVLFIIAVLVTIYSQSYNFDAYLLFIAYAGIHTFIHYKLKPYGSNALSIIAVLAVLVIIPLQYYNYDAYQIVLLLLIAYAGIHTFIHYKLKPYDSNALPIIAVLAVWVMTPLLSYNYVYQIVLLLFIAYVGIHTVIHHKLNPYGGIVIGKYKIYVISKGGRINSVSYDAIKACVVNTKEIAILTNKNKSLYVEINSNTHADLIKEKLSTKIDIKIV